MAAFFTFLFLFSMAIWLGSTAFFAAVAVPQVTGALPRAQAARPVVAMSRAYLRIGWVCALVALLSAFFLPSAGVAALTMRLVLVVVMGALAFYLAFGPGARIRQVARALDEAGAEEAPKDALAALEEFGDTAGVLSGSLILLGALVVFVTAFYA